MDNTYDCNTNTFNNHTTLMAHSLNYVESTLNFVGSYTPFYATPDSAGIDLKASKGIIMNPHERVKIPLGVRVAIPKGHVGLLIGRSSMGAKGIAVSNAVGVIDADYRGEIMALLTNTNNHTVTIMEGDRVAQLLIMPIVQPKIVRVDSLDTTTRGEGGFGSTGG